MRYRTSDVKQSVFFTACLRVEARLDLAGCFIVCAVATNDLLLLPL
jgi:hypothetical protein